MPVSRRNIMLVVMGTHRQLSRAKMPPESRGIFHTLTAAHCCNSAVRISRQPLQKLPTAIFFRGEIGWGFVQVDDQFQPP